MDFLKRITFILLLTGALTHCAAAESHFAREDQLQAAFFYKFLGYIEWEPAQLRPDSVSHLCILGQSPVAPLVQELNSAGHSNVDVRIVRDPQDARSCSLLYISDSEKSRVAEILHSLEGSGAVTVSDIAGFAEDGGMIQFVVEESHIKFIVNQRSAEHQGVRISSQLLALALKRVE